MIRATVAILGGEPMVGHVLAQVLHDADYDVRFLPDAAEKLNETLADVALILLAPSLKPGSRDVLLRSLPDATEKVPVLELVAALDASPGEAKGRILWPCRAADLKRSIADALRTEAP